MASKLVRIRFTDYESILLLRTTGTSIPFDSSQRTAGDNHGKARVGVFERVNSRSGIISGKIAALRAGSLRYRATRAVNNGDLRGATLAT